VTADGRTDGQMELPWLIQHSALQAMLPRCKKGLKSDKANYRLVSLTGVCCKLLESLIRDHIMSYLSK